MSEFKVGQAWKTDEGAIMSIIGFLYGTDDPIEYDINGEYMITAEDLQAQIDEEDWTPVYITDADPDELQAQLDAANGQIAALREFVASVADLMRPQSVLPLPTLSLAKALLKDTAAAAEEWIEELKRERGE